MAGRALGLNACSRAVTLRARRAVRAQGNSALTRRAGSVRRRDAARRVRPIVREQSSGRDQSYDHCSPHKIGLAPELSQIPRWPPVELGFAESAISFCFKRRLLTDLAGFALSLLPEDVEGLSCLRRHYSGEEASSLQLLSS